MGSIFGYKTEVVMRIVIAELLASVVIDQTEVYTYLHS